MLFGHGSFLLIFYPSNLQEIFGRRDGMGRGCNLVVAAPDTDTQPGAWAWKLHISDYTENIHSMIGFS